MGCFCLFFLVYFVPVFLWLPHIGLKKKKKKSLVTSKSYYSILFSDNNCSPASCSARIKSLSAEFCSWLVWIFKFDKKCTLLRNVTADQ